MAPAAYSRSVTLSRKETTSPRSLRMARTTSFSRMTQPSRAAAEAFPPAGTARGVRETAPQEGTVTCPRSPSGVR